MKNLTFIIILFLGLLPATVFGQHAAFDRANTLLEEQKYMEAISQYKDIHEQGFVSGALWLNIGVAYTQLDSLGKAKYYMLRASEFSETEALAERSLNVIENRFSRRSAVLPMLPWDRFLNMLDNLLGSTGLMVIGLLFLNTTAALLLTAWFQPGLKTMLKRLAVASVSLSVLFIFSSLFLSLQDDWYDVGVTIEDQATVYDEPNTESAVVSTAYEGYTMRVHLDVTTKDAEENWVYVRLANGLYGWIDGDAVLTY